MRQHLYTELFPIKPHILSITPSLAMFRHTVTVKPAAWSFIVSLYLFLRFSNFISHFLSQSYAKKLMTESYGDLSVELLRFCSLYLKYNVLFLSFLASPLVLLLHPVNASELKLGDRRYRLSMLWQTDGRQSILKRALRTSISPFLWMSAPRWVESLFF